ncbi:hypothetical protein [Salinicola tamaricis]|uniref:hypothetical protein n=1 Tax=Salinicola tamaricis TaxID=1771309 RepID=UPI003BF57156
MGRPRPAQPFRGQAAPGGPRGGVAGAHRAADRGAGEQITEGRKKPDDKRPPADVGRLENRLADLLGAPVKIHHNASGKGRGHHSLHQRSSLTAFGHIR